MRVKVYKPVRSGDYVRRAGDDVQPGDVAVRAGTIIGAAQVGLLAAVGRDKVLVHPRPRLSVISVGGELVDIDRTPGPGQVYDVNSYALAAAARDAGADVNGSASRRWIRGGSGKSSRAVDPLRDRRHRGRRRGCGASDEVREALADLGDLEVERVAMHPGSVQGFGQLGRDEVPTFLLPSNPVSALVVFEVMVRPLIRIALGRRQPMRRIVTARSVAPITSIANRKGFLRGQLMRDETTGEYLVQALGGAPERRRTCSPRWPRPTVWCSSTPRSPRFGPVKRWKSRSLRSGAERGGSVHPGWPARVGPLRVTAAG